MIAVETYSLNLVIVKLEWFQAEYDYRFYIEWVSRVETQTVKQVSEVHLVLILWHRKTPRGKEFPTDVPTVISTQTRSPRDGDIKI